MDRVIQERAAHHSFNTESALFQALPMELQSMWKQDIESAYCAGAQDEVENPTGGQLLYVCTKTTERVRKECLQSIWHDPDDKKPKTDRNCLIEMVDGHIFIARWSCKLWSFADGFPVGINENKDVMYSSWCSVDVTYDVKRWCYVRDLFPENASEYGK